MDNVMIRVVEINFAIPISNSLMELVASDVDWLRLDARKILMEKNVWLDVKEHMQPHEAKDVKCLEMEY